MIATLIASTLLLTAAGCFLLSLLPILAQWSGWLQTAAFFCALTGIGTFLYGLFKDH